MEHPRLKKGTKIEAGDLHGKMRFGGSTVVYLFEEGMVKYDEDLITRCTQDWTEKVPCPSPTCTFNPIWEDNQNDAAALPKRSRTRQPRASPVPVVAEKAMP